MQVYLGRIAAGVPLEAIEDSQRQELDALLSRPGRIALQVCDDSMINAGIFRGDILVVQGQQQARNGNIVKALIDDEQLVLKRIRHCNGDHILLLADHAAKSNQNLPASRVAIEGKIIGKFRRYR